MLGPAALQVLLYRLMGVADEMGVVLRRSALSPNIKERADCSAALFDASGELLVQAEHIPVHLGSMPASVAAAIASGIGPGPGEQVILNDPFAGGTHLNDVTLVAPCHLGDRLVAWVANRAHHSDVGGMVPGSLPPAATEIFQEGLRIPPVLLTPEVAAILMSNSRTPGERRGDLQAQVGANRVGVIRLAEVLAGAGARARTPHGEALPFEEVLAWGERRMRATLSALPDGRWEAEDVLDSTGGEAAGGPSGPVVIRVALTLADDNAHFDFSGTADQQPGNVNAVEAVTRSSVLWALRTVTDPTVPANGGALRPVTVVAPAGSVVAARLPAAVGAGNVEVSQRVADVCLRALAAALPGQVGAAGQGTMNNLILGGRSGWVYYETVGGGQGGRPGRAGMSGVHTAMTNTRDTPSEVLERAYPLRVLRYRLRHQSGGRGQSPGGEGIERVIQVLEPATLSLITERRVSAPWGLAGGHAGSRGENWLWPRGDESQRFRLADKVTVEMAPGDAVQLLTPGGGGYGPFRSEPSDRRTPPAAGP
ncbi:MAG: hydantoinase B/oxoprolinase family protein [Acidimicrobiales bacterium]